MKVLFVSLPGVGHVRPLTPLARAARAAGHDVLFATGRDFHPHVTSAGLACAVAGPTRAEAKAERLRRHPESAGIDPTEQQRFHVRKVWGRIYAPLMRDHLLALVGRWRPDLIVYDAMAFAVPLVAAATGIPAVSHSTGPGFAADLLAEAAEEVAPLWREHGSPVPPATGMYQTLHLDVWPECLQPPDLGERGTVLPIATGDDGPPAGETLPEWFADLPARPNVHLTLGTVFNHNVPLLRTVVAALRSEPINLLVSVGPDQDPADLGAQPENVRVARWLPHAPLLSTCAVVVTHGGAGTVLKSLRREVPLLLLPQGGDMFRTARACVGYGVARSLAPDEVTPEAVRAEFRKLRDEPGFRTRCGLMRKEITRLTPPAEVVPVLERLANAHPRRPASKKGPRK